MYVYVATLHGSCVSVAIGGLVAIRGAGAGAAGRLVLAVAGGVAGRASGAARERGGEELAVDELDEKEVKYDDENDEYGPEESGQAAVVVAVAVSGEHVDVLWRRDVHLLHMQGVLIKAKDSNNNNNNNNNNKQTLKA